MPRDLIPPRGRTLLHGEAGKPTSAVGVVSPKAVPRRGRRADLRAAGGGNGRAGGARRGGFGGGRGNLRAFGRRTAGGSGRGRAKKPHTRELPGSQGCVRAPGSGQNRGKPGLHPGARRAKTGGAGAKRGVRAGKRRGWWALGAQKTPFFCLKRGGRRAVRAGNWREKLAACVGLFGYVQGIFGRFRRKSWGLRKSLFTRI